MGLMRLLCNWFSMCSAESYIALMYGSAAAWKDFLLWNLYAALDFFYFSFNITIFSGVTAVSGILDF